ncbi:hypothetical protein AWM79_04435 [Pseudomonas agarici]|uniref:Autotransporter domain-containing protein n=1 Tax=Pseudomonas agarici TaxID=46677 RepID=A0A0X1SXW0_PSEAA|nr:hypothetical protein AWM79_04435 [Pseudomonas agarici]
MPLDHQSIGDLNMVGGNVKFGDPGAFYQLDAGTYSYSLIVEDDEHLLVGDGQWLAGVMAGYSQSDLSLGRGTSTYIGGYTTWLDEQSGYYFDGVAKLNRFRNDLPGSRVEIGTGVAMSLTEKWQVHADLDFSKGEKIDQPWGANIGSVIAGKRSV